MRLPSFFPNQYFKKFRHIIILFIVFAIFMIFIDPNSLLKHQKNQKEISQIKNEIKFYEKKYLDDTNKLNELNNNPNAILKIAREKYFMKAKDEDVYIFIPKPKNK